MPITHPTQPSNQACGKTLQGARQVLVIWQVPLWINGGKVYDDFNKKPPDDQAIYDMVKAGLGRMSITDFS